jgi:raffinose/stachyose/melibiose transport system permease protein
MFHFQQRPGRIVSQFLVVVALAVLAVPLALIVRESLSGQGVRNYSLVLSTTPFLQFFLNSAIVSVSTVVLVLFLALSAAYCFGILKPRGSTVGAVVILTGLALPAIALVVPLYFAIQAVGLLDTYWSVIIPLTVISLPFGVLVGTNYIRGLPVELYEAGRLDGAGPWQFFWQILVPMCRPILSVIALFTFLAAWNEYLLPLLFIQSTDRQMLTQVPTYFQSERLVDTPKIFAANILISLPIVAVFVALQKTFRTGLSAGAVK